MEFPTRDDVDGLLDPQPLPPFARVAYEPPTETVTNPRQRLRSELATLPLEELERGATVALGVGSRGIHDLAAYVTEAVSALRDRDLEPVIVPAMGSHGGATAEGQRDLLAALDVTEERIGAPIDARMDVEEVGEVTVGETTVPAYVSTAALEADGVVVLNRVKPHTNFTGRIESGLVKMAVVGLGKQAGANAFHSTAIAEGYVPTLEALLSVVREALPLLGGIALVENFYEETAHVEGVPADAFEEREPDLLERAREEMATLPHDDLDLLVVDEIGKEISGAGMDTNVIGRYEVLNAPEPERPDVDLIYVRGLTAHTKGNGNGIGLADLTRRSAVEQLDLQQTYANALTSGSLAKARLPVVAPDDELAVRIACSALGGYDPDEVRIAWIENTTDLEELYVSEALLEELTDDVAVLEHGRLSFDDGAMTFAAEE
ncbi:lactate racemase domain-containing protein [Halopiger goleimassiliensis]|uniref:lactate racemase domain-containing protein n=1 Tax=Halopiger goleimassiliensis TaxID=1293048 RepID=UPI000677994F|nr:lactate racemase domain-containing protein [Halopiger goleimassiliensis]